MTAEVLERLRGAIGAGHVLTGPEAAAYGTEWTHHYRWQPLAVLRPGSTDEVAQVVRIAAAAGLPVVPCGGRTGLTGAAEAAGRLMISLERMNRIRDIRPASRIAVVEAGVVLSRLHDAAEEQGLIFPLTFGARGSAMIGGCLSTNAGGSNVLRYGSTRGLCLGLEVVLADGRALNLMSELHKDNSGYALKDLFIGAEGTLGIITAAVLRLHPRPAAHATAMVACADLPAALSLLNRLQAETGGRVEAFEYMPRTYVERLADRRPDLTPSFDRAHDVTILVEIASTLPADATPGLDGTTPLAALLETALAAMLEDGAATDAVIAASEAQRRRFWAAREAAAEITLGELPIVDSDIAVPLDRVADFLSAMTARLQALDPGARELVVAHLGDGNIHHSAFPTRADAALEDAIRAAVEDLAVSMGGSFSAEHGIGLTKLPSMARRKDPVALDVMRAVKAALDPQGLMNPGKLLP
jgi:FAD/FMN-containing dehydrogenase